MERRNGEDQDEVPIMITQADGMIAMTTYASFSADENVSICSLHCCSAYGASHPLLLAERWPSLQYTLGVKLS